MRLFDPEVQRRRLSRTKYGGFAPVIATLNRITEDLGMNPFPPESDVGKVPEPVSVGPYLCGPGQPLMLIAGPCVLQTHDLTFQIAETLSQSERA